MKNIASKAFAVLLTALLIPMGMSLALPSKAAADITPESTGIIEIKGVQNGDHFIATRVVETTYDGALTRNFANGFSYGNFNTSRDGLNEFLNITENSQLEAAVEGFASQIDAIDGDKTTFEVEAIGDTARFEGLPMGKYLVTSRPTYEAPRTYTNMFGSVEPVAQNGEYILNPVSITAKFAEDVTVLRPMLTLDKTSKAEYVEIGQDVSYALAIAVADDSANIENVHIRDALIASSAASGIVINKDVTVLDKNGADVENAVIAYTASDTGAIVGFTIDIPGQFVPGDQFNVAYTASTANMTEDTDIVNAAQAWCNEMKTPTSDELTIKIVTDISDYETPQEGWNNPNDESDVADELTPLEQFISNVQEILQTGDIVPYAIGGIIGIVLIIFIIVFIKRKKDE